MWARCLDDVAAAGGAAAVHILSRYSEGTLWFDAVGIMSWAAAASGQRSWKLWSLRHYCRRCCSFPHLNLGAVL